MKLFNIGSSDVIQECCSMLNINSVSNLICNRKLNFLKKFMKIDNNIICSAIFSVAQIELNKLI